MSYCKSPGFDYIQGFWLKRFNSLHQTIAYILNNELKSAFIPEWMVESCTVLDQKDPYKGNAVSNYRSIACLNLLWKLLTGILIDKLYEHIENQDLFPEEQKGCRQRSLGTKDQVPIDKTVIKNCKRRKTNLNMTWMDFRKAYDTVPHSWVIKLLELLEYCKNIVNLLKETIRDWKTNLICSNTDLAAVKINRGIFQRWPIVTITVCSIPTANDTSIA